MAAETSVPKTACAQFEALLEDYLESNLSSADARRTEEHMKECAACRQAFEDALESVKVFRSVAAVSEAPQPSFSRMVMARIRNTESELTAERAGFWQSLVTLGWRFAASAAFALILLLAYDAGSARRAQPNQSAVRLNNQTTDFLFASDPAQPPANRDEVLIMVAETGHGNN